MLQAKQSPQFRNLVGMVRDYMHKHSKTRPIQRFLTRSNESTLLPCQASKLVTANLALGGIFDPVTGFGLGLLVDCLALASDNRLHPSVSLRFSRVVFLDFVAVCFRNSMPI